MDYRSHFRYGRFDGLHGRNIHFNRFELRTAIFKHGKFVRPVCHRSSLELGLSFLQCSQFQLRIFTGGSGGDGGLGLEQDLDFTVSAEQPQVEEPPVEEPDEGSDVERLINWLEELWLTDEDIRDRYTEAEWLELIESLKEEI